MLARGSTVGRYVIQRKLAEGGMAEIYLASAMGAEGFTKDVVIKVVRSFLADDDQFVQMFIAEARLASRLNHANVVQIFDFGKHDETYFLAMEFVHGASLSQLRKRCRGFGMPLPSVLAAEICAQVARGLQYAHNLSENGQKLGVVHRDVTPHNVLLSFDGAVKLTDFGIAKATTSQTAPGMLKGKFAYMSPEQGRGDRVDNRTDIFALGIVLWEMLTGARLFDGDTDVAVLRAVQDSLIPPPSRVDGDVPPELSDIVMKALARNADERFQTAFELDRALSTFVLKNAQSVEDTSVGLFMQQMFREEFGGNSDAEPAHLQAAPAEALASQQAAASPDLGHGYTVDADRQQKRAAQTVTHTPAKRAPQRATPQPLSRAVLLKTEPYGDPRARRTEQQPAVSVSLPGSTPPRSSPTEMQPSVPRQGVVTRPSADPARRPSTPSRRFDPLPIGEPSHVGPGAPAKKASGALVPSEPREEAELPPSVARTSKAPIIVACLAALGLVGGVAAWALLHPPRQAPPAARLKGPPSAPDEAPAPVPPPPQVAVEAAGETASDLKTVEEKPAEPKLAALVAAVDSPGHESTRPSTGALAEEKPPVAQSGPVAASHRPVTAGVGTLTVKAAPFAVVSANGRPLGDVTGFGSFPLAPGNYELDLSRGSIHNKLHVVIKPNETSSVEFDPSAE
jgi:serine/threonine-protein kinase